MVADLAEHEKGAASETDTAEATPSGPYSKIFILIHKVGALNFVFGVAYVALMISERSTLGSDRRSGYLRDGSPSRRQLPKTDLVAIAPSIPAPELAAGPGMRRQRPPLEPMESFKRFSRKPEHDTRSISEIETLYDEYQIQYAYTVSNNFFENHKVEEWFLERYDPLRQHSLEENACAWAAAESERFFQSVVQDPLEALKACCLEPVISSIISTDGKLVLGDAIHDTSAVTYGVCTCSTDCIICSKVFVKPQGSTLMVT
jgi:hypothetical protein